MSYLWKDMVKKVPEIARAHLHLEIVKLQTELGLDDRSIAWLLESEKEVILRRLYCNKDKEGK